MSHRTFWIFLASVLLVTALLLPFARSGRHTPAAPVAPPAPKECLSGVDMGVCLEDVFLTLAHARRYVRPMVGSDCADPKRGHYLCRSFMMAADNPVCFLLDVVRAPQGAPVEIGEQQVPLIDCKKLIPRSS